MRILISILLLFLNGNSEAQTIKEFEGIIKYNHYYNFQNFDGDTAELKKQLGLSSVFYYKNGDYKWIIQTEIPIVEYYDSKTQTVYSIYGENDTLFQSRKNGYNDSLLVFKIRNDSDSVCGNRCQIAETVVVNKDEPDMITKRILYYSPAISIDAKHFNLYRSYASNKVFEEIKCWPLKIELQGSFIPCVFIMEAVQIIPRQLLDSEVFLPMNKPIKRVSLF